jgi:hypothetical protein
LSVPKVHKEAEMPRKTVVGVLVVAVLVGCRDGPATLELPVEPETPAKIQSSAQPDVLSTIEQLVDDPLVLELIARLGDQSVVTGFDAVRDELDRQAVQPDRLALHSALLSALDLVTADTAAADIVLRDVLQLVLDDAGMLLVADLDVAPVEVADGEGVEHRERVKH